MPPVSNSRRRPPQRRPKRVKPAAQFTNAVLAAFAERLDDNGPLHTEVLLAQVLGVAWGQAEWGRTEAVEALASELIQARPLGHPAGGLLLRCLARTGPSATREQARQLLDHGLATGTAAWRQPAWVDRVGTTQLLRGGALSDVYGDQCSYYLEFGYLDDGNPEIHLIVVLIDYNLHIIKDMFIAAGSQAFDFIAESASAEDGTTFSGLDLRSATIDIAHHLWITDHTVGEVFGEQSAETRYLVSARLEQWLMQEVDSQETAEVSVAQRERILSAFMNTIAIKGWLTDSGDGEERPSGNTVRWITDMLITYACDFGVGDPLRWSPIAVEMFLVDWAPRKVNWQVDDVPWVPEVLDRFVAYCGKRKKLQPRWIQETRAAVAEFADDFFELTRSGGSKSHAAQLMAEMLADGVDPLDQLAVRRWISNYNDDRKI
ncbi:MAG: hypothetical protein ACKN9D_16790 [Actinomycetales bacterium]